jgi:hypothetical protein
MYLLRRHARTHDERMNASDLSSTSVRIGTGTTGRNGAELSVLDLQHRWQATLEPHSVATSR